MKLRHPLFLTIALLSAIALSGCGSKKEEAKPTTQAAAKVNSDEITVHQINTALARTPNVTKENAEAVKRDVLARLIDQHVAKQQAIKLKLDRKPEVVQLIESARTDILARAFLDNITATIPRPTPEEVKKYYAEHPELFSQRRIYSLQELVIPSAGDLAPRLEAQFEKSRTIDDVASWLKNQNIAFTANRGARAAEALPLVLVPKLLAIKDGGFQLAAAGTTLTVIRVVSSQAAPVTEAQATPRIQQFLFNQRATEAAAAEMKKLRDQSEITFLGEFTAAAEERRKAEAAAKVQENAKQKADAEQEAKARAELKEKLDAESRAKADALAKARESRLAEEAKARDSRAPAKAAGKAPAVGQENIEKGLRGLK